MFKKKQGKCYEFSLMRAMNRDHQLPEGGRFHKIGSESARIRK